MEKNEPLNLKIIIPVYFSLIFIFLLIEAWPTFFLPPLSDDWHMFYFIHHLPELPGNCKWLHILNYDPFEQMRFQPLSRIFYYGLHSFFGTNFAVFKLFNLIVYFSAALLIYRFSLYFVKNKITACLGIGLFIFLSNHFDIMLWAHHVYIIFGVLVFILGFTSYIRFMVTGADRFIFLAGLCFLAGLWCYEPFFFWPLAVLILSRIKRFQKAQISRLAAAPWIMLGAIYLAYALFYLFTRSLGTYARPSYGLADFLKPWNFAASVFLAFFNFAYNGILVNLWPVLAFPLTVTENVYMGGPLLRYIDRGGEIIVYIFGGLAGAALIGAYLHFYKNKYFEEIKILSFFFFLLFSVMYTLFFLRLVTNSFIYGMTEFRYQYAQNVFVVLAAVFLIDRFLRFTGKTRILLGALAGTALVLNIYCARQEIRVNNEQLLDLKKMLANINRGMQQGQINQEDKLFLDDDIPDYLPSLCWNIEMGSRFIQGTYQWMFSAQQVKYFSTNLQEASWVIDKDDFSVVPKDRRQAPARKRVSQGKEGQYLNLANYYREHKKFKQAQETLLAGLKVNPENYKFYSTLRDYYLEQGLTEEAETAGQKAEALGE
jgi:hypothetical protein